MSETYQEGKDREERQRKARIDEATEKAKAAGEKAKEKPDNGEGTTWQQPKGKKGGAKEHEQQAQ